MITKEMTIGEVLQQNPQAMKVFHQFRMGCIACMGATAESVEQGALMHGVSVDELIAALNKAAEGTK